MLRKISILPLLLILAACGVFGVPPADTFNKQAAAAVSSVNAASQLSLTLLQARKITPDESDAFIDRAEDAQEAIDFARSIRATDPTEAADRLDATIKALQILTAELEKRQ
jgi:hypothetical protein